MISHAEQYSVKSCGQRHAYCGLCHPDVCRSMSRVLRGRLQPGISAALKGRAWNGHGFSDGYKVKTCGKRHAYCTLCRPDVSELLSHTERRFKNWRLTRLQLDLAAFLLEAGYELVPEISFGAARVDLYEPTRHLAFEADGHFWHQQRCDADAARDRRLLACYGLPVIRFTEDEIRRFSQ